MELTFVAIHTGTGELCISGDDGNYMKSTIKSVAVVFGSDGSVHTRNMDGRTQIPCDCILRCFYAKNPNESKLTKRVSWYAFQNRCAFRHIHLTILGLLRHN